MCVIVRDLIVFGVLTDMMRGRPGGLRDVLELRRGRAPLRPRARRHARGAAQARPAVRPDRAPRAATRRGRTRSSCSPTTARRRARRSSSATATGSTSSSSARSPAARWPAFAGGDEQSAMVGHAVGEATGRKPKKRAKNDVSDRDVVVLGSGNLGPDLPDGGEAAADARGDRGAPPEADPGAARAPAHRLAARALGRARRGRARARTGRATSPTAAIEGEDPLAPFSPTAAAAPAAHRRLRARRRHHGRQLLRPRARRGLRVRGADLASTAASAARRRGRSSSTRDRLPLPRRADHRRRGGARAALAAGATRSRARPRLFPVLSPRLRRSTAPARPGPDRIPVTEALSYVGHSTLLLEAGGARFLTDPVLGRGVGSHTPARARTEDREPPAARCRLAVPPPSRPPASEVAEASRARLSRSSAPWLRKAPAPPRHPGGDRGRGRRPGRGRRRGDRGVAGRP